MSSNANSNSNTTTNYGTVTSEKDKLPLYNPRASTDSTASTDALLKKEPRTTTADEKKKLAEKALLSAAYRNSFKPAM